MKVWGQSASPVPSQTSESSCNSSSGHFSESYQSGNECDGETQPAFTSLATKERRARIADLLRNRKDSKMNNKLSCETQMLNCSKEDLKREKWLL